MSSFESVHHQNGHYQAHKVSDEARVEIHPAGLVFLAAVDENMMKKRVLPVFLRQYIVQRKCRTVQKIHVTLNFHSETVSPSVCKCTVQISYNTCTNCGLSFHLQITSHTITIQFLLI